MFDYGEWLHKARGETFWPERVLQVNPTLIVFLQDVTNEMEVRAMPTFLFIHNGKEIFKVVGANKVELEKKVEQYDREGVAVAVA